MTREVRAVHKEIAALTLQVARRLIWHDRTEGWPKRLDGGTCFFLRFERGIIGITANHVIGAVESAVVANSNTICHLRNSTELDLAGAIIARNMAHESATYELLEYVVSRIGA